MGVNLLTFLQTSPPSNCQQPHTNRSFNLFVPKDVWLMPVANQSLGLFDRILRKVKKFNLNKQIRLYLSACIQESVMICSSRLSGAARGPKCRCMETGVNRRRAVYSGWQAKQYKNKKIRLNDELIKKHWTGKTLGPLDHQDHSCRWTDSLTKTEENRDNIYTDEWSGRSGNTFEHSGNKLVVIRQRKQNWT